MSSKSHFTYYLHSFYIQAGNPASSVPRLPKQGDTEIVLANYFFIQFVTNVQCFFFITESLWFSTIHITLMSRPKLKSQQQ